MPSVYIHPTTQIQLDAFVADLPQSLLFAGPEGVGLTSLVTHLGQQLNVRPLLVLPEKDEKVDLEKGVITVDVIRRLYATTKTIETGIRLIVIDYAERMGVQSQNAFLKLLEEPGVNTHFILLSHVATKLLPTIRSRVQLVEVRPITATQSQKLLDEHKVTDLKKRAQLLFIASGLPAHLVALAGDQDLFEKRAQVIRDARSYLQGSLYDRLKVAQSYKDDRKQALTLLLDAMKLLQSAVQKGQGTDYVRKIDALLKTYERIEANGNARLQLASVVL